jgi:carbonic anhydrase
MMWRLMSTKLLLKVPLLMVMGHAQCGGAAHALNICRKKVGRCKLIL